jgi:hypothetical protein
LLNRFFFWASNSIKINSKVFNEGIELNDIKYKSLYIDIKLILQHKLKRKSYIVI